MVERWVDRLSLDLRGVRVLTEAATGNYAFCPGILLKAGATHVYCWAKDSSYGSAKHAIAEVRAAASALGIQDHNITFAANERPRHHVTEADLLLNCGAVRPITEDLLRLKQNTRAVVGLMYDSWELRDSDVDVDACRKYGVGLAGVAESHPALNIFQGCGALAVKMAQEAGYEVSGNKITVWSDDNFGTTIASAFECAGAAEVRLTAEVAKLPAAIANSDFIFCAKYDEARPLVGPEGIISRLVQPGGNPIGIVHLYGTVDAEWALANRLQVSPLQRGYPQKMSRTLDHLGPLFTLGLFTSGVMTAVSAYRNAVCPYLQTIVPCSKTIAQQ